MSTSRQVPGCSHMNMAIINEQITLQCSMTGGEMKDRKRDWVTGVNWLPCTRRLSSYGRRVDG